MDHYRQDFEVFLSHTDEKAVLLAALLRLIAVRKVGSLLDLGAGNGDLAIPLASSVDRYLAVEGRPEFAKRLEAAGLAVAAGSYPLPLEGNYDMVLICHVLSRKSASWKPFISAAWERVAPDGQLVIVTYRAEEDDWSRLMDRLGLPQLEENKASHDEMLRFLEGLGTVSVERVTTTVTTGSLGDMVQALRFVAGNGIPEQTERFMSKREALEQLLRQSYWDGSAFRFPFQHFLVTTTKEG